MHRDVGSTLLAVVYPKALFSELVLLTSKAFGMSGALSVTATPPSDAIDKNQSQGQNTDVATNTAHI
ncbi:hypothetical protein HYE67_002627 [Fusarium culmorum]|uniref:Uncharacterized protein n=1 Tax=Fusarium culmorum TaxID=5516 RepID=A0A2T4GV05_FUSCU|nr:hypothetical protein FCULG_00006871 [Fusarium culmorum]QPC60396.1 hypothetical protein HYE67_002627 [Fusarium culmorum]